MRVGNRLALAADLAVVLAAPSYGQIEPGQEASFLVRALQFDRNFESRSGSPLHVVAVFIGEDSSRVRTMVGAFERSSLDKGKVTASSVEFVSVTDLLARIDERPVGALYINSSARDALSSILQVSRGRKIPSLTGNRELVEKGVSLGAVLEDGCPKIVVNRISALVEGLDLSANLLRIATLIE